MDNETFMALRAVLGLLFVAGLIVILAAVVKRTGLDKRLAGNTGGAKRLSVAETMYLDPKRRLVIIKCDGREHLLLLGMQNDLLIESRGNGDKA